MEKLLKKAKDKELTITILGMGYIGLPTAIAFAKAGFSVRGFDVNKKVIETLKSGKIHIVEPSLQEAFEEALKSKKLIPVDKLEKSDVFIIAVPTPFKKDHEDKIADLSYVESASKLVATVLEENNLVILESTVPPMTTKLMTDILERESRISRDKFMSVHCPERVLPGRILYELEHNDRVIGADIIEVVDHHNIGNIGTSLPISFRTMPVGCTNTILYTLFQENNIEIPKNIAGLMISAICSDTLLLKSPTTTELDKIVLNELSKLSGINWKEYGLEMLKAGASLKGKTKEEVLYSDFKNFEVDEHKMGIGQISTFDINEFLESKDEYINLINNIASTNEYDILALFVTDIIKNGSYIFFNDNANDLIKEAYNLEKLEQGTYLDGVVSRKKQMLPNLIDILKRK